MDTRLTFRFVRRFVVVRARAMTLLLLRLPAKTRDHYKN